MSYATTSSLPVPQAGQLTRSFQLLINCAKNIQQFFISTCKQECIFQMRFSTETSIFQHKAVNAFRPENPSLFPLQHVGAGCRWIRGGRGGQRAAAGAELTREATLAGPPPRAPSPPPHTPGRGRCGGCRQPGSASGRSRGGEGRVVPPPRRPPRGPAALSSAFPRTRGGRALLLLTRRWR